MDTNPSSGWKMTQLSTLCGAGAAWIVYLCVIEAINEQSSQSLGIVSAVVAAVSFICMPIVWEYSVSAEVFSLNNLVCAAILYLSIVSIKLVNKAQSSSFSLWAFYPLYFGAFVSALAFCNQHTSVLHMSFLILFLVVAMTLALPLRTTMAVTIMCGFSFLLGLSPYFHLFLAAKAARKGSWGDTGTVEGLLRHILRSEYGTFRLGFIEGSETALERTVRFFQFTNEQLHAVPIVVLSLVVLSAAVHVFSKQAQQSSNSARPLSIPKQTVRVSKGKTSKRSQEKLSEESAVIAEAPTNSSSTMVSSLTMLMGNFFWYTLLWHGIFSNLPLSNPMAFGVHARFWMQPNITGCVLLGVLLHNSIAKIAGAFSVTPQVVTALSWPTAMIVIAVVVRAEWKTANRSDSLGWTMHHYGEGILRNIPNDSILLSHTDLDLNPARYLQTCENRRLGSTKHVHQLSLQMMPYPWFQKQQEPLYANDGIVFPDAQFDGVSTDRLSEGNARLITNFLAANLRGRRNDRRDSRPSRAIFLDMQAVNEAEIDSMGYWRGYVLVPSGFEYLVVPPSLYPNTSDPRGSPLAVQEIVRRFHWQSWMALQRVKRHFPKVTDEFSHRFPRGTWEGAAMNVYYDAHYQLGLFYLTWVMDAQTQVTVENLGLVLDRLVAATLLLQEAWDAVSQYHTFSSSLRDLQRNTALAYMRLHAMLLTVFKIQDKVRAPILGQMDAVDAAKHGNSSDDDVITLTSYEVYSPADDDTGRYLVASAIRDILTHPPTAASNQVWMQRIVRSLSEYIRDHPQDNNISVFAAALQKAKSSLAS